MKKRQGEGGKTKTHGRRPVGIVTKDGMGEAAFAPARQTPHPAITLSGT
jgi:hypothetical protein